MSKVRNKNNGDKIDAISFKSSKFDAQNTIDRSNIKFMYDKSTTTAQDNTGFEYNMSHKHRGVALIFNHFEYNSSELGRRHGTEKDVEALLDCLPLLGFESENIIVENDLAKSQILSYSYRLGAAKEEILENCDCIAIFVLSHGSCNNTIYARDDDYHLFQLVEQFGPHNFKELIAKPKLFFINGCGDGGSSSSRMYGQQSYTHPIFPDIIISLSSHPELVSFRSRQYGSWYIQDLCKSIKWFKHQNKLDKVDITAILLYTNYLVSQRIPCPEELFEHKSMRQLPCFTSTLCRQLYFKAKK